MSTIDGEYPEDELWFSDVVRDPEDDENVAPDHAVGVEDYGVTAWEARHPEPLGRHLLREVPEPRADGDSDTADDPDTADDTDDVEAPERTVIVQLFGERRPGR